MRCAAFSRCLLFLLLVLTSALAWAAPPEIVDIVVDRGHDHIAPDWPCYHDRVTVRVTDPDGAADLSSLRVDNTLGGQYYLDSSNSLWRVIDANTIECQLTSGLLAEAPPIGRYTVRADDSVGEFQTVVTPTAPPVTEGLIPTPAAPAMDAVITDTRPTFSWASAGPDTTYVLRLKEEGRAGDIWVADVGSATTCVYNFDGSALQPDLLPNHSYFWRVEAWRMLDDHSRDPKVAFCDVQMGEGRFAVYGAWEGTPPALTGRLMYEVCSDGWGLTTPFYLGSVWVMEYGTDPYSRTWIGPDTAEYPDWAPDGTMLMYSANGKMWIDALDGSAPSPIPVPMPAYDMRWASDSQRVVFQTEGPYNPALPWPYANSDIWVSNLDGTNCRPIVQDYNSQDRWPDWSPDGLWIAYRKLPDYVGHALWLVKWDGTEDHPLLPTGVEGYPDAVVGYVGDPQWSPDGNSLAVSFGATTGGGEISGIGVISRDGGNILPVFLNPEARCCGSAVLPAWSPDGTKVLFSSSHHAPGATPAMVLDPRVELWMVNADGSGGLTRLTYDHGFDYFCTWWAPNTEPGEDVVVVKGDTTVTFAQVDDIGYTSVTVYEEPIGLPTNFELCGDQYQIETTAQISGLITIQMQYREEDIPSGVREADLRLLHFNDSGGYWEDITTAVDTVNNLVSGETTSLSVFAILGPRTAHFSDVPSYGLGLHGTDGFWAFSEIEACLAAGIVSGYPDGTYRPTLEVTRDQMAVYISRALAGGDSLVPTGPETATFPDVPTGYWAFKYVEYAVSNEVVEGYGDGTYGPALAVTRDQMAVFVARAMAGGDSAVPPAPTTASFPDVLTDHWAFKYVEYIHDEGVVSGYEDGTYRPATIVTRDQMAVYVQRAFALPR